MSNSSAPLPTVTVNVTIGDRTTIEEHEFESDRETEYESEYDSDDTVDDATADSPRNEAQAVDLARNETNDPLKGMANAVQMVQETRAITRDLCERVRILCEREYEKMARKLAEENRAATDEGRLHSADQLSEWREKLDQLQGGLQE
ncbi:hypothetical protein FA95DRAFT_1560679 [Auriscalpium vulgare]|uniref:Uncharacterized protein n=1 Tax=Auriscalpium vulgare TaxID=40419 RepID=A0ACB8RPG8_9AGAM|nr:hypothetical protein FA95DRAFT_1560679 [Auriscalpium vulgare]